METLPQRRIPLLYFYFGGICLILAIAGSFRYANDFTGFYYHPRILALTHLITLGWISSNIIGAIYIACPMSLQLWLPYSRFDAVMFACWLIGVSGMVTHFWTATPIGIAGSAFFVYVVFLGIAFRVVKGLKKAKAPGFVKMHLIFSFANLLIAALWGILIALNKEYGFLPTQVAPNLYAHAHLAAVGWVLIMIFGFSYRLLPMFLPAEPAKGVLPWISGILVEAGIAGLFLVMLLRPELILAAVIPLFAGFLLFILNAVRTVFHLKKTPPPAPPIPDYSMLHVLSAFLWLCFAAVAGILVVLGPSDEKGLRLALTYGFSALFASMSQMVLGIRPKLLAIFTWYHVFAKQKNTDDLPRPIDMGQRTFQTFSFVLWTIGSFVFAAALWKGSRFGILAGAALLFPSVLIAFLNEATIIRRLRK